MTAPQPNIKEQMAKIREVYDHANNHRYSIIFETMFDKIVVEIAGRAMTEKLAAARGKGRRGWWDKEQCSIDHLNKLLHEHLVKGDMVDVMNLAAMLHVRRAMEA